MLIKDLPPAIASNKTPGNDCGNAIRRDPSEITFFKHVHAECEKVSSFFAKAKDEIKIRFERVHNSSQFFQNSGNTETVRDRWALLGKSAFKLHSNLLLLETFAILNYCAFSKILKKHDKRTGYTTKVAFMQNVVNKSNFTNYPDVLRMIRDCEVLYDRSSSQMEQHSLREDERLFLVAIRKFDTILNEHSSSRPEEKPAITRESSNIEESDSQIKFETLPRNLVKTTKRLRTVSLHSDASYLFHCESESREDEPNDTIPEFYDQKHIAYHRPIDHHSKKRRCLT